MRYCNRIKRVRSLGEYRLKLLFDDGYEAELDFAPLVAEANGPLLRALQELVAFQKVDRDHGVLTWPNGYDICSDVVRFWCESGRVLSRLETDAAFLADSNQRIEKEPATFRETSE